MSPIEKAILAAVAPLLGQVWTGTIAPAIQAELKSASPEIQALEDGVMALLNKVVPAELTALAQLVA